MQRTNRLIWIAIVLFAILVLVTFFYSQSRSEWQDAYRARVNLELVELLQTNPYEQTMVVVIVIDGLRYAEGIGAEDRYLPHIWNDLGPLGTLLTNYRISSPTATTSSHAAMLTGRISTVPNDGHVHPVFPTFLEHFRDVRTDYMESRLAEIIDPGFTLFYPDSKTREEVGLLVEKAGRFDPERTACYFGKDLIHSLDQSSSGHFPEDDLFLIDSMRDIEVTEYFQAKLPFETPNIVFVNLGDVDEAGHEAEWFYYVDTIRWADRLVYEMYQSLQVLKRYRGKTLFIVTTDHGRHALERGGYPHHGCFCDGCQHSFMLLIGPGIRQGYVSDEPHTELDLAPTIASALGFSMPAAQGSPIMEAFENPEALPEPRITETCIEIETDVRRVDENDSPGLLLENYAVNPPDGSNEETALLLLAVASRVRNHPDESSDWAEILSDIPESIDEVTQFDDLLTAYPMTELGRAFISAGNSDGARFIDAGTDLFNNAVNSGMIDLSNPDNPPELDTFPQVALISALAATVGNIEDNPNATRLGFKLILDKLAEYEGEDRVYNTDLEGVMDGFRYRDDSNVLFTEAEISYRDRMWLLWGADRVIRECNPDHVLDLYPKLRQQVRLMVAFTHEWQDENAVIGGSGDLAEEIDFVAQGLFLAVMSEFEPWRRWELEEMGYSPNIYATPLFDWQPEHFFYILGQVNALAGAWAADERMKLYVNDDGTLRDNLINTDRNHSDMLSVSALAYGLSEFENADYSLWDLEMWPIVHQQ